MGGGGDKYSKYCFTPLTTIAGIAIATWVAGTDVLRPSKLDSRPQAPDVFSILCALFEFMAAVFINSTASLTSGTLLILYYLLSNMAIAIFIHLLYNILLIP